MISAGWDGPSMSHHYQAEPFNLKINEESTVDESGPGFTWDWGLRQSPSHDSSLVLA